MLKEITLHYKAKKVHEINQIPLNYLYIGHYYKVITQDDITFKYPHYDCFLANASKSRLDDITELKRLTGSYENNQPMPFTPQKDHKANFVIDTNNNIEYILTSHLPSDFACEFAPSFLQTPQHISRTRIIKNIEKINSRNIAVSKRLAMYQNPIEEIIKEEFGRK